MRSATDGLQSILPAHVRVSTDAAERVAYARDYWPRHLIDIRAGKVGGSLPAGIVWPTTTEEVASIVSWCAREGVPIVPYGAGSGVCGGVLPEARTIVVDLKRMKK
ncbi:MAG: FAD-binding oxidoreductase, partial [Polyangiales bacterium]